MKRRGRKARLLESVPDVLNVGSEPRRRADGTQPPQPPDPAADGAPSSRPPGSSPVLTPHDPHAPPAPASKDRRSLGRLRKRDVVGLAAGLAILAALVAYVGPQAILHAFATASPRFLVLAFVAYATFFVLRGIRWGLLLRDVDPGTPLASTAGLSAAGWTVSTFIPLKAGDAFRAAFLARRRRVGFLPVAGSIAVERALDTLAIAALATLGLVLASRYAALPPVVGQAVALTWLLPIIALAVLILIARITAGQGRRNVLLRSADQVLLAVRGLSQTPRRLPGVVAMTVLVAVAQVSVFVFLFLAFSPRAPLGPVLAGVPIFVLSFVISVTPGNVGTYEAAFVAVFALMGFAVGILIPMAVAIHILTMLYVTLLGAAGFALAHRVGSPDPIPGRSEVPAP